MFVNGSHSRQKSIVIEKDMAKIQKTGLGNDERDRYLTGHKK